MDQVVFVGTVIHCLSLNELEVLQHGILGVSGGRIEFLEDSTAPVDELLEKHSWSRKQVEVVELGPKEFLFPGFIDTHIHASQYPNCGVGLDLPLLDWLNQYTFPLEASYNDIARAKIVYDAVVRKTLSHGTTTACYFATLHPESSCILADCAHEQGQRAYIGKVCMDSNVPDDVRDESVESAMTGHIAVTKHLKTLDPAGTHLNPVLTPRFAISCSPGLMQAIGDFVAAHPDHLIQTHIAENKTEVQVVREMYPGSATYADVYDRFNLLNNRTVLAHCVHLSPAEVNLLRVRGTGISHCPISNTAIQSGMAPVKSYIRAGAKVSLGTDCSGGYSPSILEVTRHAINVSRHLALQDSAADSALSLTEALYLATLGGAVVLDRATLLGNFVPGKWFDALRVSLGGGAVDVFDWETDPLRLCQKWVYTGDDRNIKNVWVHGRLVKR